MSDPGQVFREFIEMWASGDLSKFDRLVSTGYAGHVAAGDRDREGLRERILTFRRLFPSIRFDIEDQFSSGERVATRMIARGNDAEGRTVTLMGINISIVRDGAIEQEWNTWERL
jgi:hypothetical protein